MPITSTFAGPAQDNADRLVTISHFDDAGSPAAASYNLGFIPRYVRVDNVTDRILNEWYSGMTSDHAVKTVAAGTRTLETSAGITLSGTTIGFPCLQNKQYRVVAFG